MKHHHEASIARLFTSDGITVGTGILVTEEIVLTCAHVIASALDMHDVPSDAPNADVCLDFPLVAPRLHLTARVTFWLPPQPSSGDIALLHLNKPAPEGTEIVHFVTDHDLWSHDFRTFGFPAYHDQGVWASGKLRAREATGWVQIEDVKATGHRVQPGFSGGAVWDELLDSVAGMVVAAESDPTTKTAYMIPTKVLIAACPQLGQHIIPPCPYRGLLAFREQDAPYFFGRKAFTQQLVEAASSKPLTAVIGPSGSGKSSVVFAGLLPRLRIEGHWTILSFHPGHRPFHALAAALIQLLEPQKSETDRLIESNKLARSLQQGELALQDVVEMVIQKQPETRLLLVVDQFEELYTLCRELEVRQRWLDELSRTVLPLPQHRLLAFHIVLTLRANFLAQVLSYRPFADALHYADLKLGPMNEHELQAVIEKPAEHLHVRLEEGLTRRILHETHEGGQLPLLEFALTLLWARQREGKLTHRVYEEIGGVGEALADHAEQVYQRLDKEEQRQAQAIFVQLVRPGEGTEDTRRFTSRGELDEDRWNLVVRLANARLVVTTRDEATGEEIVEVVHEALIQSWQRLRQ